MLKFIFGRPASGKTYNVLKMIKESVAHGRRVILIVPEQFSFESEKEVLHSVGDSAALTVSVMSFSRLFDEVGRNIGGSASELLADRDKIIFMHRALAEAVSECPSWKRYSGSVSFAKTMVDTVNELKLNAVTAEQLRAAAEKTESAGLREKLRNTAAVYDMYDMLIGEKFIDPSDILTVLYRQLENYNFFDGCDVYIDGFKGFTGQQYKILERIIPQSNNTVISLTNDTGEPREYDIFTNIRGAVLRIERIAEKYAVDISEPFVLEDGYNRSREMAVLERLMAGKPFEYAENVSDITVINAATPYDEAEFAARTIRKLIREGNYRYRDFVIIARDADSYSDAVETACEANGVACFTDKRVPLSSFPVAVMVKAAVDTVLKPSTEHILKFHKTGLGTLNFEEISELENYTYLWNIDGDLWNTEWDMNPKGFVNETDSKDVRQQLIHINDLRQTALSPILNFSENFRGSARDMAAAVFKLIKDCSAGEKLSELCKDRRAEECGFPPDALKQGYGMYIDILDSLVKCLGGAAVTRQSFADVLDLAVCETSVGTIPQTLDEVTFGSADRIRPSRPKVAFILGANQGVFPRIPVRTGIFAVSERREMIELGLEISDNAAADSIDESFLVYSNVCCPSERIYISSYSYTVSGEKSEPSAFVSEICENLNCTRLSEPENLSEDNLPETEKTAYARFCGNVNANADDAATVRLGLSGTVTYDKTENLLKLLNCKEKSISHETALKLYGRDIPMSASKFDTFHRCKFSFFCRYGLRAKKIQPADFDVLQRGTLVHYVLERIISAHKKGIAYLTEDERNCEVDKYINEYLDGIKGYRSVESARSEFLVSRISRSLKEVVGRIAAEFSQSDFEPVRCELKIGRDGEIPPLAMPYSDGKIMLEGSIDRVDTYNGYVRIIDYKTGSRTFKLPDILFGLNLQMLIYLYAVIRGRKEDDKCAAGIFYMPSKRDLNGEGLAMNGLAQADEELVTAMEKKNNGEFIPKLRKNKDGSLSKLNNSYIAPSDFSDIFDYIERLMKDTGDSIMSGDISVDPTDGCDSPACKYCDYSSVCGREESPAEKVQRMANGEVLEKIREVNGNGV